MPRRPALAALCATALGALTLAVSLSASPALAAGTPRPGSAAKGSLTVYTASDDAQSLDVGQSGPSDGDQRFRHSAVSLSPGGPTVGEMFLSAVTLRTDYADGLEWRLTTRFYVLPGGTITVEGINKDGIGALPVAGTSTHDVVLGGTGTYRGARGEAVTTFLSANPWRAKTTFLFTR